MKMFFSLMIYLLFLFGSISAQNKTCCDEQKTVSFTKFAEDKNFREQHQIPSALTLKNPIGKMITFKTEDGKDANAYLIRSKNETKKWIFVFHEWWGLNDYIKKESDELKTKLGDVNILAIDLYDGKVANNREDAAKYMQSVDQTRAKKIINGAINFVGKDAQVATIGWCFGGGWSLQASIILSNQGSACVLYYGIIDNTPETFNDLKAPVLGIFAEKDGWITPEVYGNLQKNIKAAGKEITIKSFDADHAFANPSNSKFDEAATNEAKDLTINFIRKHLLN